MCDADIRRLAKSLYLTSERFAPGLKVPELVEAGEAGSEKHRVTGLGPGTRRGQCGLQVAHDLVQAESQLIAFPGKADAGLANQDNPLCVLLHRPDVLGIAQRLL